MGKNETVTQSPVYITSFFLQKFLPSSPVNSGARVHSKTGSTPSLSTSFLPKGDYQGRYVTHIERPVYLMPCPLPIRAWCRSWFIFYVEWNVSKEILLNMYKSMALRFNNYPLKNVVNFESNDDMFSFAQLADSQTRIHTVEQQLKQLTGSIPPKVRLYTMVFGMKVWF